MQINIHTNGLKLSDRQNDYLQDKILALGIYKLTEDPSALARVDVEFHHSKISDQDIKVAVTMTVPQHTLRAEALAKTVEEGTDLVEAKLRQQLEKLKK